MGTWAEIDVIQDIQALMDAQSWTSARCTIEKIWLQEHTDLDGDTSYSIEANYHYRFANKKYKGDRYKLKQTNTGWSKSKKQTIAQLKKQKDVLCFVNPHQPTESTIDRRIGTYAWWLLFPIPFIVIGIFSIRFAIKRKL